MADQARRSQQHGSGRPRQQSQRPCALRSAPTFASNRFDRTVDGDKLRPASLCARPGPDISFISSYRYAQHFQVVTRLEPGGTVEAYRCI